MKTHEDHLRDAVNLILHDGLGADAPCTTACTHVVMGWSALGIAKEFARHAIRCDRDPAPIAEIGDVSALTRIPLTIQATATGTKTEGILVAVMASELDALERDNESFRERLLSALGCAHRFDPECARCEWLEPFKQRLEAFGLPAAPGDA